MHKTFMSYNMILDKQEIGEDLQNLKLSNFIYSGNLFQEAKLYVKQHSVS